MCVYKHNRSRKIYSPVLSLENRVGGMPPHRGVEKHWANLQNSMDLGLARIQKCPSEDWWGRA